MKFVTYVASNTVALLLGLARSYLCIHISGKLAYSKQKVAKLAKKKQ